MGYECLNVYIWNTAACSSENGKYAAITCDEIIESYHRETKTILTNFNENKAACKMQNFYILLAFLVIIVALLIVVSIYCYLIKNWAKQKHFLSFRNASNKLRKVLY